MGMVVCMSNTCLAHEEISLELRQDCEYLQVSSANPRSLLHHHIHFLPVSFFQLAACKHSTAVILPHLPYTTTLTLP